MEHFEHVKCYYSAMLHHTEIAASKPTKSLQEVQTHYSTWNIQHRIPSYALNNHHSVKINI